MKPDIQSITGSKRSKRMAPKARYCNDIIVLLLLALAKKVRSKETDSLNVGISWADQRGNPKEVRIDNISYI